MASKAVRRLPPADDAGLKRLLAQIDVEEVDTCYEIRVEASLLMRHDLRAPSVSDRKFAESILGMVDPAANYSASDHGLGPKILSENRNAASRVRQLAMSFEKLTAPRDVPDLIYRAGLTYCRVGVGSEMSAVINPKMCWVCNVRTLWLWLAMSSDVDRANEELELYREANATSEIYWPLWKDHHRKVGPALARVVEAWQPDGDSKYPLLLGDAIANIAYETFAS